MIHTLLQKNVLQLYQILCEDSAFFNIFSSRVRKVLDVGIGSGMFAKIAQHESSLPFQGLDINNDLFSENKNIPITVYNGKQFPFNDKSFDLITVLFVIHHCKNAELLIKECQRVSSRYVLVVEEIARSAPHSYLMKLYDLLVNLIIFNHMISVPNFNNEVELENLFKINKLRIKKKKIIKKNMFVIRVAYLLER